MEIKREILGTLSNVFAALEKAISSFDEKSFNEKPTGSNWSPAMVAQHLVLAGKDFDKILLGNTKPTEGPADIKVAQLKEILLDYDLKMTAPAFIEPADESYDGKQLIAQLNEIGAAVSNAIPNLDLTETCLDFELPGMGYITRLEAVYFLIYHTQRHTHQINEMADRLSS